MITQKIFYCEESPYHPGTYMIAIHHDKFYCLGLNSTGSYHVLQARIMGLTYANYLRMCRDVFGANIIGKKSIFPVAYFSSYTKINDLIKQLNVRATAILWNKTHSNNKVEVK